MRMLRLAVTAHISATVRSIAALTITPKEKRRQDVGAGQASVVWPDTVWVVMGHLTWKPPRGGFEVLCDRIRTLVRRSVLR